MENWLTFKTVQKEYLDIARYGSPLDKRALALKLADKLNDLNFGERKILQALVEDLRETK